MTSTQDFTVGLTAAFASVREIGERCKREAAEQRRNLVLVDCPDCVTVDDPADCPTCAGERVTFIARAQS